MAPGQGLREEASAVDGMPGFPDEVVVHLEPVRLKVPLHLKDGKQLGWNETWLGLEGPFLKVGLQVIRHKLGLSQVHL